MITLRLGARHVEPKHAQELIDAILRHEKSCDIVWFATLYGYPPLDVHADYVEKMKVAAEMYRKAGIGVSMQISNTIGHGEYMKSRDCSGLVYENSPAEPIVDISGKAARYCFCWRGPHFRSYLEKTVALYAEVLPDVVWFDDDLRPVNHAPVQYGCFCDSCVAKFNRIYGSSFDCESLANEICYGDVEWRRRFIEFTRAGISDFVTMLIKAMQKVSPKTRFGLQLGHFTNYAGTDDCYIYDAIKNASGFPPQCRPGAGFYNDKHPLGQFEKALQLNYQISIAPDYVSDFKAEVENLPDVVFGKSIRGTVNESTAELAAGCTGLTYATLMADNEPVSWHEKMLAEFSKVRPYWEKLSYISKNHVRGGLCIYHGEAPNMKKLSPDEHPMAWAHISYMGDIRLPIIGIPITHDRRNPSAYVLFIEKIDYLTDNDIEFLLSKPVLTDAASVKKLCDRGYADRFRLNLEPMPTDSAYEIFTAHPVNGDAAGTKFTESSFFSAPMQKYLIEAQGPETEILSEAYHSITEEKLGDTAALTAVYDKNGNKTANWAVFGYCVWNDIISAAKRNQILNASDAIAPLPAKLVSAEQAVVYPSVDRAGRTVSFTVASASQGGTYEIEVLIRNPASENFKIMSTKHSDIRPLQVKRENGDLRLTLPELLPYEILTVFLED